MNLKNMIKYLVFALILAKPGYSDEPFRLKGVKVGASFSHFKNANSGYEQGGFWGVSAEKRLFKNAALAIEATYSSRGGIIKDAPIAINAASISDSIYTYDIHCRVGFFEIPIYLKLTIPLSKDLAFYFLSGPYLSSARKDFTSIRNKKYLSTLEEYFEKRTYMRENFTYDAGIYSSNRLDKSLRLGFNWGVGIRFNRFTIESRYSTLYQDLGELGNIYSVRLRTYSIQLILGVDIF